MSEKTSNSSPLKSSQNLLQPTTLLKMPPKMPNAEDFHNKSKIFLFSLTNISHSARTACTVSPDSNHREFSRLNGWHTHSMERDFSRSSLHPHAAMVNPYS
jgi:hypothetical protein